MYPNFNKIQEVQVSGDAVCKMELNYEGNILFCGGADGQIAMITIKDHDPKKFDPLAIMQ